MTDDSEFGPWIQHDGKGCPCVGQPCEVLFQDGRADKSCGQPPNPTGRSWSWVIENRTRTCLDPAYEPITHFRIRKPRALLDLIQMVADLPAVKQPAPGVIA